MSDSSDSDIEELTAIIKNSSESVDENEKSDTDEARAESPEIPRKKRRRNKEEEEVEDEKDLNAFLFGDKEDLVKNLRGKKKTFFLDTTGQAEGEDDAASASAAWHDSDDDEFVARKGEIVREKQRKKLERIANAPKWADLDRDEKEGGSGESDSDEDVITRSVGFLDKNSKRNKGLISRGEITFKRLKNLNRSTENEGTISSIQFHPKSFVGVVAGQKGLVSLFAVDGRENKKIHNICYDKFYIHSCKLTTDGEELIVGGKLRFFHIYNLMSGYKQRIHVPRGMKNMRQFELSPCGKYIAVVGDFGEVFLLHAVTKELLFTFKQEHQSTSLNFSPTSNELFSHSDDNEVTIFDIRTQKVKHRFVDEGCVNGTVLSLSPNGSFLATGSRQGFVNIYKTEDVAASKFPQPLKVISNLSTEISDLKFNHTSELLGMCSVDAKNAIRLVHVESGSVYSNFPSHLDNVGSTNLLSFSPESGYLAFGTLESKVPLYRLNHYNNY